MEEKKYKLVIKIVCILICVIVCFKLVFGIICYKGDSFKIRKLAYIDAKEYDINDVEENDDNRYNVTVTYEDEIDLSSWADNEKRV